MITNNERREVAARLRELDTSRLYDGMDEVCALEDACGCGIGQDWQDMELKDRLAELIEPESKRTSTPKCYLSCGHEAYEYRPSYCPVCGAKVVER